jgi:hypothetical protein
MSEFPTPLPLPQQQGYALQHASPLQRAELHSGRSRQRRRFATVPSQATVNWLFDDAQLQTFEDWFHQDIDAGADWFDCRLKTPLGLQTHQCRFAEMYQGPTLAAPGLWRVTAKLEIKQRVLVSQSWVLYAPTAVAYATAEMAYAADIDTAINDDWPT